MTTRVNSVKNVSKVETITSEVKVSNVIADKIKSVKCEKSNAIVKSIAIVSFKFANVRSAILSYVANDNTIHLYDKDVRILILRKSKKDSDLYKLLCDCSEFSYKVITTKDSNKVTQKSYHKSYTVKSVLNVCDLYDQLNAELNVSLIASIKFEREKQAIDKLKNSIEKIQAECNFLSMAIEVTESNEVKTELADRLKIAEKSLKNKVEMLQYVSSAANRSIIK